METLYVKRIKEVNKNKRELTNALRVTLTFSRNSVTFDGKAEDEFDAEQVFRAIDFGFSVRRALLLKQEDFVFRTIHIRDHTKRNLKDILARLIGTKGKTRRVLSDLSDCEMVINEGDVGLIGYAEDVSDAETAIVNLIKGSKQSNMYKFLEKRNREKKESLDELSESK